MAYIILQQQVAFARKTMLCRITAHSNCQLELREVGGGPGGEGGGGCWRADKGGGVVKGGCRQGPKERGPEA